MGTKDLLGWAWGLGYRIAVPLLVFTVGGRLLDKQLGTSVVFLLTGIFLSLGISGWLVWREIKELTQK